MKTLNDFIRLLTKFFMNKRVDREIQIKRVDLYASALNTINYMLDNKDSINDEMFFMGNYIFNFLTSYSLPKAANETKEDDLKYCEIYANFVDKFKEYNLHDRINTFSDFIHMLCLPKAGTSKEELKNKIFVFKDKFYADEKDVDILFRTMHASTVNKSLLRKYGSLYRNRRLDYVKEVAAMAIKEFPKYNLTLDEAEKQFMDLCELIDKYYNEKPKLVVGSRKSKSQLQKPKYFIETMQVMLKKTMPSSK